jgi:hypothetical protein
MLEDPESLGPVIEEEAILGGETEPAAEPELDEMVLEEAPMVEETLEESFEELAPTEEVAEVEEADGAGLDLEAEAPGEEGLQEEGGLATLLGAHASEDVAPSAAMQAGAAATAPEEAPAWEAPEEEVSAGEQAEEEAAPAGDGGGDSEFDDLFSSLKEEIAAHPEGERLEDVLRNERIRDRVAELEFALPQHESSFARALGVYALPGDGEPSSAYPAASRGNGGAAAAPPPPAAEAAPGVQPPPASPLPPASAGMPLEALSLLDPDIRAKLGQVLDEIISMSVRKAVQEEMPKIVERMAKDR